MGMPAMPVPKQRSSVWPLLAAIGGIVAALALGNWQLDRAAQKREAQARFEAMAAQPPIDVSGAELAAADVDLRRVQARGVFDPRHAVYIDNRIHRGVPGYEVVMPLKVEGSDRYVLVNRGWVARTADRAQLPPVATAPDTVTVRGIAMVPHKRTLELSDRVMEGAIWQNLTIERYREARPLRIQPFLIRQDNEVADGLVREWEAPDFGIDRHYGYAFQWFALAATLFGFYAFTQFRRHSSRKPPAAP
jgi:surfeit locus 1 family protein